MLQKIFENKKLSFEWNRKDNCMETQDLSSRQARTLLSFQTQSPINKEQDYAKQHGPA